MLRDAVASALGDEAGAVQLQLGSGVAGKAVIDAAMEAAAELIVIGTRPALSLSPGTAGQYVLRNTPCPVLIVPPSLG